VTVPGEEHEDEPTSNGDGSRNGPSGGIEGIDGEGIAANLEGEDLPAAHDRVVGYLVSFVRLLRREGVSVPADGSLAAARALAAVGLDDADRVRAALRAALVSDPSDLDAFDRLFPEFWRQLRGEERERVAPEMGAGAPVPPNWAVGDDGSVSQDDDGDDGDDESDAVTFEGGPRPVAGSDGGGIDDATASEDGTEAAVYSPIGGSEPVGVSPAIGADDGFERAVRRLGEALGGRRGRRWQSGADGRIDTRRVLRESLATGGTALSLPRRERRRSEERAVVLVDVSRSVLDTVDRQFLLRFLRSVVREWDSVRVFFFDTGLREATGAFDADGVSARGTLERVEAEWGGGTRIGHALERLRHDHPDAVDRETAVLVVSDGLEVGEVDVLERGMAWLGRQADSVVWLNPLAASPDYEPACRGMAAALPYVDGLFAFAGPGDVAEAARQLDRRGPGGTVGYRQDPRRTD
jgi:uncharacterized protein with von Willebrand factor type A (vWA) domain